MWVWRGREKGDKRQRRTKRGCPKVVQRFIRVRAGTSKGSLRAKEQKGGRGKVGEGKLAEDKQFKGRVDVCACVELPDDANLRVWGGCTCGRSKGSALRLGVFDGCPGGVEAEGGLLWARPRARRDETRVKVGARSRRTRRTRKRRTTVGREEGRRLRLQRGVWRAVQRVPSRGLRPHRGWVRCPRC